MNLALRATQKCFAAGASPDTSGSAPFWWVATRGWSEAKRGPQLKGPLGYAAKTCSTVARLGRLYEKGQRRVASLCEKSSPPRLRYAQNRFSEECFAFVSLVPLATFTISSPSASPIRGQPRALSSVASEQPMQSPTQYISAAEKDRSTHCCTLEIKGRAFGKFHRAVHSTSAGGEQKISTYK